MPVRRRIRDLGPEAIIAFVARTLLSALALALGARGAAEAFPALFTGIRGVVSNEAPPVILGPSLAALAAPVLFTLIGVFIALGNYQIWRAQLARVRLLTDETALIRDCPRAYRTRQFMLADDQLVGLSQRIAHVCRFYRAAHPALFPLLVAYLSLLNPYPDTPTLRRDASREIARLSRQTDQVLAAAGSLY